jgi:putative ABC transport system permease protein
MSFGQDFLLALRLAKREMRSGLRGFGVFLACLALGVGAIATVETLSGSVDEGLRKDARKLLGGDLEVRQSHRPISPEALRFLLERGQVAQTVQMRIMARSSEGKANLAALKAVDANYPLYGAFQLKSGEELTDALAQRDGVYGAVAEATLLDRLSIGVGDRIRLGEGEFRVTGVITREPDRVGASFRFGPRVMIKMEGLAGTGLIRPGSVVSYLYKVALFEPAALDPVQEELKAAFPNAGWRVRNFTSATAGLDRFLRNLTLYLTLVSLTALLVGGTGVAGAVRSYLESKTNSIATMKCLGADRRLIISIYLCQTLFLALVGSALGIGASLLFSEAVSPILGRMLGVAVQVQLRMDTIFTASAFGLLTAIAFSLWALSAAGAVSPARLFRGYADLSPQKPSRRAGIAVAAACLALYFLVLATTQDQILTACFAAATLLSVILLGGFARIVMKVAAIVPRPKGPRLRHAVTNLHRPGSLTQRVFFSLGLGLTALVAVALVEGNLQNRIQQQIPEVAPSYFFLDVQPTQISEFRQTVTSTPGVSRVESMPAIRGRITKIKGVSAEKVKIDPEVSWVLRRDRAMTYAARMPESTVLTAGKWWPEDYRGEPLLSFDDRIAKGFGVNLGDTLTLNILGREITARIASLREIDWGTLGLNYVMILAPGTLDGAPHTHIATAYASGEGEKALFKNVTAQFPNVVAIYVKDILKDVSAILASIGFAVRAMASITLLAGLLVLIEAIRANLKSRHYEAVIFKVVGATRRDIILSLAAEFILQGLATALLAALLGTAISFAYVEWILRGHWTFLPGPLLTIVAGGVLATLLLGLTGVRSTLSRKAWPMLRNE